MLRPTRGAHSNLKPRVKRGLMTRVSSMIALAVALALGAACNRSAAPAPAPANPASAHATAPAEAEIPAMSVADLAAALERHDTVAVYDANGAERYAQGHLPGARHVGHDQVTAAVLPQDRATRLVFYCYNEH